MFRSNRRRTDRVTSHLLVDILVVDSEPQPAEAKAKTFTDLYRTYARGVFRFALYLSGDDALAQDITSETFLRIWLAEQPVRVASVKGWLLVIARNIFRHELRHLNRRTPLDPAIALLDSLQASMEAKDRLGHVRAALSALSEVDRFAVLLRVEGLPYAEIAATLEISIAAAKMKVHRASAAGLFRPGRNRS